MIGRGLPRISPLILEALLVIGLLAGLYDLFNVFRTLGYLPAPFVFDVSDTFMDWFNTAYWSHNPGAYSVWNTIYAPLSFVITKVIGDPTCYASAPWDARNCDVLGIVGILAIYFACVVATAVALYRRDRSTALFRTIGLGVGGPMLFALERGNLIMWAYLVFVLFYGQLIRSKVGNAIAAAVMINLKSYLLFPVLGLIAHRRWRALELAGFATLGIYFLSMFIINAGTPFELVHNLQVWFDMRAGTIWDEVLYSTTYKPYLLFDVRQYPIRDYVEQRSIDIAKIVITGEVIASRAIAMICVAGAYFYPKAVSMQRIAFFILMQSFMNQNPGGYAIAFIVFLVFMEEWRNWGTGLAIACCYLVSIPTDLTISVFYHYERESWLSGRLVDSAYGLPLGALVRPGLLVIVLWSLAIDSLIDIHRAIKTERPNLGLGWRRRPDLAQV
ncbi:MAG: hypothetical protein JWL66_1768 [Sphingomonadales bacterium]|nr:hypothetical protein [Sphingomonadales bacterium]